MNEIRGRVFIVGCPRSGTTLLQSLLAANSQTASFPETHFFEKLFSGRQVLSMFGIASRRARRHWPVFLEEIGLGDTKSRLPIGAFREQQFARSFVAILDEATCGQGKIIWIEKTPGHLHYVDRIERLVRGAKFLHVLRNGEDVVASLYDIGTRYPNLWGGYTQSIDLAIARWKEDTQRSMNNSLRENHMLIRYEELVTDPEGIARDVCSFLDVSFETRMLNDYRQTAKGLVLEREPWKQSVDKPIRAPSRRKYDTVFNESQKRYIEACLRDDFLAS